MNPPTDPALQPVASPDIVDGHPAAPITDVTKSLWQYIWQRKRSELVIFVPLVVALEVALITLFVALVPHSGNATSGGKAIGDIIVLPLVVFSGWLYKLRKQFEDTFLQEFAASNGYAFEKSGLVDETYGTLFRIDGRQSVSDIVSGDYQGDPLRLFLYQVVVGEGRSQQRYDTTVMELDMAGQLPEMLLVNTSKRSSRLNIAGAYPTKNTLSLEGNFNEHFTLYAPPQNEIEARQVFTPDVMAIIYDLSKDYSVEFAAGRLYLYATGWVAKDTDLQQMLSLVKQLRDKLAPLAGRLQHDSAMVTAPVNLPLSDRARRRVIREAILALIILCFGAAVGFGLNAVVGTQQPDSPAPSAVVPVLSQSDIATAKAESQHYLQLLDAHDIAGAQQLESPHLRQDAGLTKYLTDTRFAGLAASQLVDQSTGSISGAPWVGFIYQTNASGSPFYLKLQLAQYSGTWLVYLFDSSTTPLSF